MSHPFPSAIPWRFAALLCVVAACTSDGNTDPTGAFTIALEPAAITVVQGGTGPATVTLTRTDGYAGAVTFDVQGTPTGVTGSVSGSGTTAISTRTVMIAVGAGVAPGVYNLNLLGSADGLTTQSAPLALTVTAAGAFEIVATPGTLSLAQGGSGSVPITLTRTGTFTGAVALASVTGAPDGVTATFLPTSIPADATTTALSLSVGAAVPTGSYPLVITSTSDGFPQATTTLTLVVAQPVGSFTLTATQPDPGIIQGATGQSTITLARTGGFSGAVALALSTTTQGITAEFAPAIIAAGSTTSVVTFTVPAGATTGSFPLEITGTGAGAANTVMTVTATVLPVPTGSFSLQFAPAAVTVQAGAGSSATLTLTRTAPFDGGATFTFSGVPANVMMSLAPAAFSAGQTTAVATLATTAAVPAGSYPIVVTGMGTGVAVPPSAATTFTLTVTAAPPAGAIGFQFCDPARAPLWFAYQDQVGVGPWTPVAVGANTTYNFDVGSTSGGVAWVEPDGSGGFRTTVYLTSKPSLETLAAAHCADHSNNKTVTGSASGLAPTDRGFIGLGTSGSMATDALPTFTIRNVAPGNRSMIAARSALNVGTGTYSTSQVIIRRGQNIANGGAIPIIDFAAEGFAPTTHTLTVLNQLGWMATSGMQYFTDNGGSSGTLVAGGSAIVFPAVPSLQQAPGDLHFVSATANPSLLDPSQYRSAGTFFLVAADQTVTLGAIFGTPTLVNAGGSAYARLRATGTVQGDYDRLLGLSYAQPGTSVTLMVTGAPFVTGGGATYTLVVPDFSGVAGWMDAWMPANGVQTSWNLFGQGWTGGGILDAAAVEGTTVLTAGTSGTLTP